MTGIPVNAPLLELKDEHLHGFNASHSAELNHGLLGFLGSWRTWGT